MPRALLGVFVLGLAGCGWNAPHELEAPFDAGDPYEIVLSFADSEPDQPPGIAEDSLVVRVRYAGECESHTFSLDERVRRDTTVLQLHRDAHGDACEAWVTDEIRLALTPDALASSVILLRHPQGGPPFRVQ